MNLNSDIIGTDPQYPKVTNHDWLKVDPALYDNYPSDNNPIRVLPELSKMWNHESSTRGLIPNEAVQPLGLRSAEKKEREDKQATKQVVREAKKAVMAGLRGSGLAQHLRARFTSKQIEAASEGLKKVSNEIGLLGNVYIDASAFETYEEAKQFLRQHSHRLARDLLFDTDHMNPHVVSMIASNFRKNVVSSIDYNSKLFEHYKNHLVASKRIPKDAIIDSREALKTAFLYEKPVMKDPKPREVKKASEEQKADLMSQRAEKKAQEHREAADALLLKKVRPIIVFAQEALSKGKSREALKEMLKNKYAMADIEDASQALTIVISSEGLNAGHIDSLNQEGHISDVMAEELKKVGKKFPVRRAKYQDWKPAPRTPGVQGYEYSLSGSHRNPENDALRMASIEALKKGFSPDKIREKLSKKLSREETDKVISEAISDVNASAVGSKANALHRSRKKALVEDPKPRQTLPDEETTMAQTKELREFFGAGEMVVDVDPTPENTSLDVEIGGEGFEVPS